MPRPIYTLTDTVVEGAISLPIIKTVFRDFTVPKNDYDAVVFTSKNAVSGYDRRDTSWREKCIFTIGEATRNCVHTYGTQVQYTLPQGGGNELAQAILGHSHVKRVLYPHGAVISSSLPVLLKESGIDVYEVVVYETICVECIDTKPPKNSIIIFSSPSSVRGFQNVCGWDESYICVAIGHTTAAAIDFCEHIFISPERTLRAAVDFAKRLS